MATLQEVNQRISGIEKTKEITQALKMVAMIRVRNAQQVLYAMRPYSDRLARMIASLCTHEVRSSHPLLAERKGDRVLLVVVTSDKGLCGSFNTNILRYAEKRIREIKESVAGRVEIITIGKKGTNYLKKHNYSIISEFSVFKTKVEFEDARKIGEILIEHFTKLDVDRVELLYNFYQSTGRQEAEIKTLLPIAELATCLYPQVDYIYEPEKSKILDILLPLYVNVQVWRILQESSAGENGARMTAMDNANQKCEEMIEQLTLEYNKARQNSITRQIIEVVSSAEAFRE